MPANDQPAVPAEIWRRLEADRIDDDTALLVAAAFNDDELAEALAGLPVERPAPDRRDLVQPERAYLAALAVEGFRGIGPRAELQLKPAPGLTVVAGRNGSGKSSFAEAVEMLLTGENSRWADRPADWQSGWRNLHAAADRPTTIEARFAIDGQPGEIPVRRWWDAGATAASASAAAVIRNAGKQGEALGTLGWDAALASFRPFLPHSEVGSSVAQAPSNLYDAMYAVLGLQDVAEAHQRLRQIRLAGDKSAGELSTEHAQLLEGLDRYEEDPRATRLRNAMNETPPDPDQIECAWRVVNEWPSNEEFIGERLADEIPDADAVVAAIHGIQRAERRVNELLDGSGRRSADAAVLLEQALRLHEEHGDQPCPICKGRDLDPAWRTEAEAALLAARREAADWNTATRELEMAMAATRDLARPMREYWSNQLGDYGPQGPKERAEGARKWLTSLMFSARERAAHRGEGGNQETPLDHQTAIETALDEYRAELAATYESDGQLFQAARELGVPQDFVTHAAEDIDPALRVFRPRWMPGYSNPDLRLEEVVYSLGAAWEAWADLPDEATPSQLVAHLSSTHPPLVSAVNEIDEYLGDGFWEDFANLTEELPTWAGKQRAHVAQYARLEDVRRAENWLRRTLDAMRDERFDPISEQAVRIWNRLSGATNVELVPPKLAGAATSRKIRLEVLVDGASSDARGVMSQGELNSLALSLFLPRALLDESPFGFVVIDDPVQAMDPSKVDGLARVLADAAAERQVVVFTHDDRLPEAIRRLQIEADLIAVTRSENSVVQCRRVSDPVSRYLDDARAISLTPGLPPEAARRSTTLFLRLAIEAACTERIRSRRIGRGELHAEVATLLERAASTNKLAALALFDDADRHGDVRGRISSISAKTAEAYGLINAGTHTGNLAGFDPSRLLRETEQIIALIRAAS